MLKILEKGRILLVCDENKTQKTVVRTLENDGYDVERHQQKIKPYLSCMMKPLILLL